MRVGLGTSLLTDGRAAAAEATRGALEDSGSAHTLLVFASARHDGAQVLAGLGEQAPGLQCFGASSLAEVSNLGTSEGSVVVVALAGDDVRVTPLSAPRSPDVRASCRDLGRALAAVGGAPGQDVCLVAGDFQRGDGTEGLRGLRDGLGRPLPLFGCGSGARYTGPYRPELTYPTFELGGREQQGNGLAAALLSLPQDGPLRAGFGFAHGWTPLSRAVTCTRCEGNFVYEVDGTNIFDYYSSYLGEDFAKALQGRFSRYSFLVELTGCVAGHTVVRSPIYVDERRRAVGFYPADPMDGLKVRLVRCGRGDLATGARRAAQECLSSLGGATPQLVLVVSCGVRRAIELSRVSLEAEQVAGVFGPTVPLAGLYASCEFGPPSGPYEAAVQSEETCPSAYHHGMSICLLALGTTAPVPGLDVVARARSRTPAPAPDDGLRTRADLAEAEDVLDEAEQVLTRICLENYRVGEDLKAARDLLEARNRKLLEANERTTSLQDVIRRYTPHAVWAKAGHSAERGQYEIPNEEVQLAFLFMDIKGFTAFSEQHEPDEVIRRINAILGPATELVYDLGGDVDKFIGDALLAHFARCDDAVAAAKRIQAFMAREAEALRPLQVRIGINHGRAVQGNVGARMRKDHTLIGDAVNLAQRLESACTPGRVLVAAVVFESSALPFAHVEKRSVEVKGKSAPVACYECWD